MSDELTFYFCLSRIQDRNFSKSINLYGRMTSRLLYHRCDGKFRCSDSVGLTRYAYHVSNGKLDSIDVC